VRVAIIGAGAIGSVLGGYLTEAGEEVTLIGHRDQVSAIREKDLSIDGIRGKKNIKVRIEESLTEKPDLIFLTLKTQDVVEATTQFKPFISQSLIVTMQNGIRSDRLLAQVIEKADIINSVVLVGATYLQPGKVLHNFEGKIIIGRASGKNDSQVIQVQEVLNKAFPTKVSENIRGVQWLKLLLNLNNALPGITGKDMQKTFSDERICRISIRLIREAVEVIEKAKIELEPLPDFPISRLTQLLSLPLEESAHIYSRIMIDLSPTPLPGSILQSIKRNKSTEIDYLNGEIVSLGKRSKVPTPLNSKIVELVHKVERDHKFYFPEDLTRIINNV